jgi:hypothetical protein
MSHLWLSKEIAKYWMTTYQTSVAGLIDNGCGVKHQKQIIECQS